MKTKWTLQKEGKEDLLLKDAEKRTLEILKGVGIKRKDIETLDFYFNGNDGNVYYVAHYNGDCEASGKLV